MCQLQTCCCINIEVGTQIISILSILTAVAEALALALVATKLTLPLSQLQAIALVVVLAAVCAVEFVCACVLAHGTFQKQPSYMRPWIFLAWVKGGALVVAFIVDVTAVALAGPPTAWLALTVAYMLYALILFYFACVVGSRRKEIQQEDSMVYASRLMRSDSTSWNLYR